MSKFQAFADAATVRFREMDRSHKPLFRVEQEGPDHDSLWGHYLVAFEDPVLIKEHDCSTCRRFIRFFGGMVTIGTDGRLETLWQDLPVEGVYQTVAHELHRAVASRRIENALLARRDPEIPASNWDIKRLVTWNHLHGQLPARCVVSEPDSRGSELRSAYDVLLRGVRELKPEAIRTVLELIEQGSLYRGNEHLQTVRGFQQIQQKAQAMPQNLLHNWLWGQIFGAGPAVSRIRNSAIGTLLVALSEGTELEHAVSAYERVVAPTNYRRPTALVTPRMVDSAKQELEALGLVEALNRRVLEPRDLNVNNALFVHRPTQTITDVFDDIKAGVQVDPGQFDRVEEVPVEKFIRDVLPTVSSIKLLLENRHMPNFVSLVGPVDPDCPALFGWGNAFSWSYSGQVADSIRERVKQAGGNVHGIMRVSLSWHNYDDLDLHVVEPHGGVHIAYYSRYGASGGKLDVDMNAGVGRTRTPVENIVWPSRPLQDGVYRVLVDQFCRRETRDTGFELELELDGKTFWATFPRSPSQIQTLEVAHIKVSDRGNKIEMVSGALAAAFTTGFGAGREKWGLQTGNFVPVSAVTLSPNYWQDPGRGNRHFMFFLEGCKSDEEPRGFYNEFLSPELAPHRKVWEVLGGKVQVQRPEGPELSGLGFADTQRNHVILELQSSFRRHIKVLF